MKVWKDTVSGVIYIDDFYTGDETYIDGSYRDALAKNLGTGKPEYERTIDTQRRLKTYLKYITGKKVLDFGCGNGDFLKLAKPFCVDVLGVELQENYVATLNGNGIECVNNLEVIEDHSLDIAVSFHVLEHLPNPVEILTKLKSKLACDGHVLIEVPHANDFLLSTIDCDAFKQFTIWSQHLVLHTRESLRKMLEYAGFQDIIIEGVQRYPLSNHLNWLANSKAGGHKSPLSMLDSDALFEAYQSSLARIDATDTLVAYARVS
ncbi:class I SAM-dependent methyltransferase [Polycladidibacter stylochi]|uniref:class I SAM-dependent methyltransferase n=1 Tax=Polycladidibacter stylochi TaxID=1807766 RepID=UPI001AD91A19|nr:class I SAM-dependent methyltransferase [Pseudovibrio stylochi]